MSQYTNSTTIGRDMLAGDSNDELSCFASDLQWTPGFAPRQITVECTSGAKHDYALRYRLEDGSLVYLNYIGNKITVYND